MAPKPKKRSKSIKEINFGSFKLWKVIGGKHTQTVSNKEQADSLVKEK